ncbi:MAG: transposase [Thermoguttaceae bacterium]
MSEKPQRRTFSAAQKVAIVKRHLIDKVAVSDLCEEYQIQPTLFYQWQKQLFENGTAAFERKGKSKATTPQQRRIAKLETKLVTKNEVIVELMEENVKAKKKIGEL